MEKVHSFQCFFQYGGFSEHLMMMVGEVFRGLDRFERMTEIYLDSEACNTLLKMSNSFNRSQDTLTVV